MGSSVHVGVGTRALPSVERYLRALPAGASSYPECLAKASVMREWASKPFPSDVRLPPSVEALLDALPPVSAWVPEVHRNVVTLALFDVHYGEARHAEFAAWTLETNKRVFSRPLYRALFFVMSPERLFRNLSERWSMFRRGMNLVLDRHGANSARLVLVTPPDLVSPLSIEQYAIAFRAAGECAGAKAMHVAVPFATSTEIVFDLAWA